MFIVVGWRPIVVIFVLLLKSFTSLALSASTSQQRMVHQFRSVQRILDDVPSHWVGDGFKVYPVFADLAFTKHLSPLLMFDYAAPKTFPPNSGKPLGVGQHPHRGFETVTVVFQGEAEHHDSTGKSGIIGPGDIQWMTAGRGIVHQEYHSKEFSKQGGTFEVCQLWVNLPKKHKMTKPGYQHIRNEKVPVVELKDGDTCMGKARIIAGELGESRGAARTFTPVQLWDVSLPMKNTEINIPYPGNQTCMVFVRRGSIELLGGDGEEDEAVKVGAHKVALMQNNDSTHLRIRVLKPDSSILIMGGEPIQEPIVNQGPFVMNDQQGIMQAITDYRSGKMGR